MALVVQGYVFEVTLMDAGGGITTKTYQLRATDAAAAATAGGDIVTALNAVTDLIITQTGLKLVSVEDTIVYPATAEKEDQAIVDAAIVDAPNKTATFTIPGPNIGIFTGTTGKPRNVVDITDAALVTYANLFAAAGVAYISDGEDLDFMREGRRRHVYNANG